MHRSNVIQDDRGNGSRIRSCVDRARIRWASRCVFAMRDRSTTRGYPRRTVQAAQQRNRLHPRATRAVQAAQRRNRIASRRIASHSTAPAFGLEPPYPIRSTVRFTCHAGRFKPRSVGTVSPRLATHRKASHRARRLRPSASSRPTRFARRFDSHATLAVRAAQRRNRLMRQRPGRISDLRFRSVPRMRPGRAVLPDPRRDCPA